MRDGARRDTDALSASAGLTVLGKNGSRAASSDKRTMRLSIDLYELSGSRDRCRADRAFVPDQEVSYVQGRAPLPAVVARNARARARRAIKRPPTERSGPGARRGRIRRPRSHGHEDGGEHCRRRPSGDRLCPSAGTDGQARGARPQADDGYCPPVRLRVRHQHAAGRCRRSRGRIRAPGSGARRSRQGDDARRNPSLDEHDQYRGRSSFRQ